MSKIFSLDSSELIYGIIILGSHGARLHFLRCLIFIIAAKLANKCESTNHIGPPQADTFLRES